MKSNRRVQLACAVQSAVILLISALAPASALGQKDAEVKGKWSAVFDTQNVMIHASVLPDGTVLFWGRREAGEGLNPPAPRNCTPRIWDPKSLTIVPTANKPGFNLFCSGHAFMPDGRLLVVGGHIRDGHGEKRATTYDAVNGWVPVQDMNAGRWYPTAVTLADGGMLVSSGAIQANQGNNTLNQVLDPGKGKWRDIVRHNDIPLYPRMHLAPDGRVFMSGHLKLTQLLNTGGGGAWQVVGDSHGKQREDGCSVLYDEGKVLIVGGGQPPQETAEIIDLNAKTPAWKATGSMAFRRRHHNATLLPDGTVLVTGGTSKNGQPHPFNDLSSPVKVPELWDPVKDKWFPMAEESKPRLYHSVALLLPDGRVLSAGGGEYALPNGQQNNVKDSLKNAQIYSPPYLCRGGDRPTLTVKKTAVKFGETFPVDTAHPEKIGQISWVRLPSVTHSLNMNQRINFLKFTVDGKQLKVTAPADGKACPPGHYMLFLLNKEKVPSIATIIRID